LPRERFERVIKEREFINEWSQEQLPDNQTTEDEV
jgi:hypothetical protein